MIKLAAKVDKVSLAKRIEEKTELVRNNIQNILKDEAFPHLIDLVMSGFDRLIDRANMHPEDPTNPANWREEFRVKLIQDLENTFINNRGKISVKLGEKSFLGYDSLGESSNPEDTSPLHWLVFYIEGLAGEWAFITPELYEKFRGAGTYQSDWGRFGQGFMISKEQFEAEGWSKVTSFEAVLHPFSGYAPLDIFTEALREFDPGPFINKAVSSAIRGVRL